MQVHNSLCIYAVRCTLYDDINIHTTYNHIMLTLMNITEPTLYYIMCVGDYNLWWYIVYLIGYTCVTGFAKKGSCTNIELPSLDDS